MAKKKDKPQVVNNIQELNLEIDYDKLAEAIVKAQNQSTIIESYNEGSEGGYEYIQKTLSGKIKRNYFTFSLSKLICWMFYAMGIGEVYLTIIFIPIINKNQEKFLKLSYLEFEIILIKVYIYLNTR